MKIRDAFLCLLLIWAIPSAKAMVPREFNIPNIPGYVTLTGDLHIHTCFSDGSVWPVTRVAESAYDDLDFISMTDHMDSRLQKMKGKGFFSDKVDQNTSYLLAKEAGGKYGVMVFHGAELTRGLRIFPGHFNVHFIDDVLPIVAKEESEDAKIKDTQRKEETAIVNGLKEAKEQKAFITFNHPSWHPQQPVKTEWLPFHERLLKEGLVDGIEIVNSYTDFCPEAFHWGIEKGLTIVSGTDCHASMCEIVDYAVGAKRARTLVFAKEKTQESIREALFDGRTLVYNNDCFYGREDNMRTFFKEALKVVSTEVTSRIIRIKVKNVTSVPIILQKDEGSDNLAYQFYTRINPGEELNLVVSPPFGAKQFGFTECNINYKVMNYFIDTDTPLRVSWHLTIPQE